MNECRGRGNIWDLVSFFQFCFISRTLALAYQGVCTLLPSSRNGEVSIMRTKRAIILACSLGDLLLGIPLRTKLLELHLYDLLSLLVHMQ
jgi:hypothetical protein